MAGTLAINNIQLGDSLTASQNFVLKTNSDGTATLARGNVGATTQDILTIASDGKVTLVNNVLPFSSIYESSAQTITSAGLLTLPHGLGVKPKLFMTYLKCLVPEQGYLVGDEVNMNTTYHSTSGADSYGVSITYDTTNLYIKYASTANVFVALSKTTGNGNNLTNANWQFFIRAWA